MSHDRGFVQRSKVRGVRLIAAIVLSLCLLWPAAAFAYQLPLGGNNPESVVEDLPSMTLLPDDYGIDGLATTDAHLMGPAWFAEHYGDEIGEEPEDVERDFGDMGLNAVFFGLAAVPTEDDPGAYAIVTQSTAIEFGDVAGAEEGFAYFQIEDSTAETLDAPEVGDESILKRLEAEEGGQKYVLVGYVFRSGNLLGIVEMLFIDAAMSGELDADHISELAGVMEGRMGAVRDGDTSALGLRVLRLDGSEEYGLRTHHDSIDIADGMFIDQYGVSDDEVERASAFYADTGVIGTHRIALSFEPAGKPDDPGAVYVTRISEFGSRREARDFVEYASTSLVDGSVPGSYNDPELVDEVPNVEGQVAVVSYAFDFGGDEETTGYRVWVQTDNLVVSVEADSLAGVDLDVLFELVEQQVACAEAEGYCEPITVPEGLFGQAKIGSSPGRLFRS